MAEGAVVGVDGHFVTMKAIFTTICERILELMLTFLGFVYEAFFHKP